MAVRVTKKSQNFDSLIGDSMITRRVFKIFQFSKNDGLSQNAPYVWRMDIKTLRVNLLIERGLTRGQEPLLLCDRNEVGNSATVFSIQTATCGGTIIFMDSDC
ncbi:hypothetical protein BDC45DRAFT_534025 [Circinella umbellata]|nr:hypothetical protein BDC45DRAFT_534025 [Circinella umbellata]